MRSGEDGTVLEWSKGFLCLIQGMFQILLNKRPAAYTPAPRRCVASQYQENTPESSKPVSGFTFYFYFFITLVMSPKKESGY